LASREIEFQKKLMGKAIALPILSKQLG